METIKYIIGNCAGSYWQSASEKRHKEDLHEDTMIQSLIWNSKTKHSMILLTLWMVMKRVMSFSIILPSGEGTVPER
jgi:hypothetical protein